MTTKAGAIATEADHPTALISYSHDSPEHEHRVLGLCNRLRARGVDAFVDQFLPGAPSEGWPLWMERQIETRDFTLMVCTEAYRRRFMEDEVAGAGRGVVWEARILRNLLYEDAERHGRIVPVLLSRDDQPFVPTVFRGHYYDLSDELGFEQLLRHLLREPGADAGALGSLGPQGSRWSAFERPWLIPDAARTLYFTGREELIAQLREQLTDRRRAALCGLGGVGKTQAAIEYAVRYRSDYPDGVYWINAETASGLSGGFVDIAKTLRLAAAASDDQEHVVRAVLEWLNGTHRWLLIFDNVADGAQFAPFVPQRGGGHILITSRESILQDSGIPRGLEVLDFDIDEAVEFLFKRTGRDGSDGQERASVVDLAGALGRLPLALEQAAAYIAETSAAFSDYLDSFQRRRVALLEKSGSLVAHATVAVTWAANFEAVERESPPAAEVLRLSAFLSPDAVPFEVFLNGARELGVSIATVLPSPDDRLAMGELLRPLTRYSLVRPDPQLRAFSVHRMVQEIVRREIGESGRRTCVEAVVRAVAAAFPEVEYATWAQCDRLVPHVAAIAGWIDARDACIEVAAHVFNETGRYLDDRGRYAEAEALHKRALDILEHAARPDRPEIAMSLHRLANVREDQGKFADAEVLHERALAIREEAFGLDHPLVASSLHGLANVYCSQGRNAPAEPLYKRAIAIREHAKDDSELANHLNGLALVYWSLGRYAEAQPLYERAQAIWERELGPDHPDLGITLANLASLHLVRARYPEARLLYERALKHYEVLGPDHPRVGEVLNNLALVYMEQGDYAEAQQQTERALAIRERTLEPDHPHIAQSLNNLANIRRNQGRYAEARSLYERALAIRERALEPDHYQIAESLDGLARLHLREGRHAEAQQLSERALAIWENALGSDQPDAADSLDGLAEALLGQGHFARAEALYVRARDIRERSLDPDHPGQADSLHGLAHTYRRQRRDAEAWTLFERALTIRERTLGSDHTAVADTLVGLALLLVDRGLAAEATAYVERARAIKERVFGVEHPEVVQLRDMLAAPRTPMPKSN